MRAALLLELKQIKAARAAIQPAGDAVDRQDQWTGGKQKLTIKAMILKVLETSAAPKTSDEIIELIKDAFGVEVARTSLSPQLSRLRHQDGELDYDDTTSQWSLSEKSPGLKTRSLDELLGEETEKSDKGGAELWE
jgi:hypothetical protein